MAARDVLAARARVRRLVRTHFDSRGYLEVDTPVLAAEVLPEAHIDPLIVSLAGRPPRWLQASPENLMKRLLAAGSGAIYQLAHAFRDGERGPQHDVEFMLVEWYAPGTTLDDTADDLADLCQAVLGTSGLERISCAAAFRDHAGIDPVGATADELVAAAIERGCTLPEGLAALAEADRYDRVFELLLAEVVQPRLGHRQPTMLEAWPASQAAFARIDPAQPRTARRFELFVAGVELVNGWEEETGRDPLAARIAAANAARQGSGRARLPTPERLLAAHGAAMPAGVGAALGFDRLVMLAEGATTIDAVRCFPDGQ
ncbi:MAG: Elongation factor P--(R)-beta-lysine ligase [Planctomycetota bacterium]